jgi:hypothetical protein
MVSLGVPAILQGTILLWLDRLGFDDQAAAYRHVGGSPHHSAVGLTSFRSEAASFQVIHWSR